MEYVLTHSGQPNAVVNFCLTGEHLQPEIITHELGITPDDAWAKGDQLVNKKTRQPIIQAPARRFGAWRLASPSSPSDDFEEQLDRLLNRLEALPPLLHQYIQEFKGTIVVGYSSNEVSIGLYLSSTALQRLAQLGLAIVFDIYPLTRDNDDDETA